ncbi:MAG: Vms1/Ankzf1 family peptidyl-tRNA hydrolase, partial [Dehalococcoidia bacterium]
MIVPISRRLGKLKVLALLEELESGAGTATSLYLPPGSPVPEIEKTLQVVLDSKDTLPDVTRVIARSATGAVLFWGDKAKYLILPPFPIMERLLSSGYDVEPLRLFLRRELMLALILVRLGAYAIGVFQGERLLSSKVGKGLVHSRHKKGGSSQRRFERGREKQIERFFDRVCTRVRERL